MNDRIMWLKVSFLTGAIVDAVAAVMLMFPALYARFYQWPSLDFTHEVRSTAGAGAALMWGWTALLIWANRKPLERKGVLALTVFPVLVGLMINRGLNVASGFASPATAAPGLALQTALLFLFSFSYWSASWD